MAPQTMFPVDLNGLYPPSRRFWKQLIALTLRPPALVDQSFWKFLEFWNIPMQAFFPLADNEMWIIRKTEVKMFTWSSTSSIVLDVKVLSVGLGCVDYMTFQFEHSACQMQSTFVIRNC